jgi:deoxyribose-phosphate aldolase
MIEAGASRIGASAGVRIVHESQGAAAAESGSNSY